MIGCASWSPSRVRRVFSLKQLSPPELLSLAEEFGLDRQQLSSAWAEGEDYAALRGDQDLAMDLLVKGSPHFFVNGRRLPGAKSLARFEALVSEELGLSAELVSGGVAPADIYSVLMDRAFTSPGLKPANVTLPAGSLPSLGPPTAPVVIQMFSDFECRYCQRGMRTLAALRARYPNEVRVVFRHLPLAFHRNSRLAAAAANEAYAQQGNDGFWRVANLMFNERRELNTETLIDVGDQAGLNTTRLAQAIRDGRHEPAIVADEAAAQSAGARGTPAFIVGGYSVFGAQPLRRFERLVRQALRDAEAR